MLRKGRLRDTEITLIRRVLRYCWVSMKGTILHGLRSLNAQRSVVKTLASAMGMIPMHRLCRKAGGFHSIKGRRRRDLPPVLSMSLMKVVMRRGQHDGRARLFEHFIARCLTDELTDLSVGSGGFNKV